MTTRERVSGKKETLQTRLDQIVQGYRTWLARPPYHVLKQEHRDRTDQLGEAIGKLAEANRRIALLTDEIHELIEQQVERQKFMQEVMIFVQNAPILVRNGKPWQVKRDSLVARAKAQNWYREPGQEEQEAEQVTE